MLVLKIHNSLWSIEIYKILQMKGNPDTRIQIIFQWKKPNDHPQLFEGFLELLQWLPSPSALLTKVEGNYICITAFGPLIFSICNCWNSHFNFFLHEYIGSHLSQDLWDRQRCLMSSILFKAFILEHRSTRSFQQLLFSSWNHCETEWLNSRNSSISVSSGPPSKSSWQPIL